MGDQIRTLDTRFANLHTSIAGKVTADIDGITNSMEGMQGALHAEIADTRGTIAENAARCDYRSEEAAANIASGAERTTFLEANLNHSVEALQQEDARISENLESTATRLTSFEANLNHSVARLQGEDALIAGAIEDGLARVANVEKSVTESIEHLGRIEKRQFAAQEDALNKAARTVALEEALSEITETLHNNNVALENRLNDAIAHASTIENNLTLRIQELYDHVSAATTAAAANGDRIAALDEKSENLRIGFNRKMSELCAYFTAQIKRNERQSGPRPRQEAPTPALATTFANVQPATAGFTPPAAQSIAASPAPPSHDSPHQHPQSGFGS